MAENDENQIIDCQAIFSKLQEFEEIIIYNLLFFDFYPGKM